jgi:exodeoxyribonuclease VII small subunit
MQTSGDAMSTGKAVKFADIRELSFERSLKELESIVGRLERGDVELEESIAIHERGEALKEHCDRLLKQAEAKVEKLTLGADGQPRGTTRLDPDG